MNKKYLILFIWCLTSIFILSILLAIGAISYEVFCYFAYGKELDLEVGNHGVILTTLGGIAIIFGIGLFFSSLTYIPLMLLCFMLSFLDFNDKNSKYIIIGLQFSSILPIVHKDSVVLALFIFGVLFPLTTFISWRIFPQKWKTILLENKQIRQ